MSETKPSVRAILFGFMIATYVCVALSMTKSNYYIIPCFVLYLIYGICVYENNLPLKIERLFHNTTLFLLTVFLLFYVISPPIILNVDKPAPSVVPIHAALKNGGGFTQMANPFEALLGEKASVYIVPASTDHGRSLKQLQEVERAKNELQAYWGERNCYFRIEVANKKTDNGKSYQEFTIWNSYNKGG